MNIDCEIQLRITPKALLVSALEDYVLLFLE